MKSYSISFCHFATAALALCVANATAAESTVRPANSGHRYVYEDHGVFGYRRALSDVDRANGIASPPLTLVRLKTRTDSFTFFSQDEAGNQTAMQCSEPCAAMRVGTMTPAGGYSEQVIPVDPGGVLAAIMFDARHGYLDSGIPGATPGARAPAVPASTPVEELKAKLRANHESDPNL
jgi:hypothetical protein